jgi:hypothetical protein
MHSGGGEVLFRKAKEKSMDSVHRQDHRHSNPGADSVDDLQESLHQAVDIGFAVADLIGSIFGFEDEADRTKARHILHSLADESSDVFLALDSNSRPYLGCTGPNSTVAVVIPVTTQDQTSPAVPMLGQISSQVLYVQGGTQLPFAEFQNYTQGMVTVTQVDTSSMPSGTKIGTATLQNFSTNPAAGSGAQTIALMPGGNGIPALSATVTDGQITFTNNDMNTAYSFVATLTTANPTQVYTLYGAVGPGGSDVALFPSAAGASVIQHLSVVAAVLSARDLKLIPSPGAKPLD